MLNRVLVCKCAEKIVMANEIVGFGEVLWQLKYVIGFVRILEGQWKC
jgi:hypothetical protein